MLIGRHVLQLLYTDETLNNATGVSHTFATAFRNKLAYSIDNEDLILEWAIAAILDPRQKQLGKYHYIFYAAHGTKWLSVCSSYWTGHDDFVQYVSNNVVKYARDMADDDLKSDWPLLQQEREIVAEIG